MCKLMDEYLETSRNEGRAEGRAEGEAIGKLKQLKELVKDGMLKAADAAAKAGMTEQEFTLLLK